MSISVSMDIRATRSVLDEAGTPNPLWPLISEARNWEGVKPLKMVGGRAVLRGITNTQLLTLDDAKRMLVIAEQLFGVGAVDILNYPARLKINEGVIHKPLPGYVPIADYEDEQGNKTRPNYSDLHEFRKHTDGHWYAAAGDGVSYFPVSVQLKLNAEVGVHLLDISKGSN